MVFFIMGGRSLQLVILLVGFLYISMLITITGFSMGVENSKLVRCIERERQALLSFKQGLIIYDENLASSWRREEEDCCRWEGIGCDNQTGHVILLDLSDRRLGGLVGPSLLELQYLNHLDLSYNYFSGRIPEFMGSLTKLAYLNLSRCHFDGAVPHQLGNLSSLHSLDLSYSSGLKADNLEWLSRLSSLKLLDLGYVDLSKAVDWLQSITKLPSLSGLLLRGCQVPGIIPPSLSYINSSKSLAVLDLGYNRFNSSIFSWLFNISTTSLVELSLSGNQLIGPIPDSFGDTISLEHLDLSSNDLEGGIPKSLWNLCNLQTLDLSFNNLADPPPKNLTLCAEASLKILRLSNNQLSGSLPDFSRFSALRELDIYGNRLDGSIPKSFDNLSKLVFLDLSDNRLTGSLTDFSRFSALRELYIYGNRLDGSIPKSFDNLSKLVILKLQQNRFTGSLPDFTRLSALRELYIYGNRLDGSIPKSFDNLSRLVFLDLSDNRLNGSLPDFSRFSSLQELHLGGNQLKGPLPKSVGQLSSLRFLNFSSNFLNGVISEAHLSNLSELEELDLSFNSFALNFSSDWVCPFQLLVIRLSCCKMGPRFPSWLRTQNGVYDLDISNSGISEATPDWFWNLSTGLIHLNLSFNQINAQVPNLSLEFSYVPIVDLSSNLFYGPIPPFLLYASVLNLSKNKFSGFTNHWTSSDDVPVEYLDVSDNQLSGGLPDFFTLQNVKTFRLSNNQFSGKLPLFFKNWSSLTILDLGENKFSGEIPTWIGESLRSLIVLCLRSNEFDGNIPVNICHLKYLHVLDLSLNNISGSIPPCLNNFAAMAQNGSSPMDSDLSMNFYIKRNIYDRNGRVLRVPYYVTLLIVWKGKERQYDKTLTLVKVIDLSRNKLTGEIPEEVTSLIGLLALNLSSNNLTGLIPEKIGQLKSLESLDLCRNQLSGGIPQSLTDIDFLSYLNLSNNDLFGKIPSSTQLRGFDNSTYSGNPKLCGPPLSKKCPGDDTMRNPTNTSDDQNIQEGGEWFGIPWSYVSMAFGFTLGFWGVCGTLLLNSSWRQAYFRFLNDMWDWFYVTIAVNLARLQRRLQR